MNRFICTLSMAFICSSSLLSTTRVVEAQSGADKRFLLKTSLQAEAKPVQEVLKELCEKHKLPVEFDPAVAAEAAGETPFSLTADGLTLGSAIHLVCESARLVSFIEKGRLMVTTREADASNPITRDYALNLVGPIADVQVFAQGLMEVTSGPWEDVDGEGGDVVAISPRSLSIRQSRVMHVELQSLFEQLAVATTGRAQPPTVQDRAEQVLFRKLQTPVSLPAGAVALPELLDQLLKKNGLSYWVDADALGEEGLVWTTSMVTPDAKKMSIAARLDAALSGLRLSWRVADEVVQITTKSRASEALFTRVYDVRRLIAPNQPLEAVALQLQNNKELGPWGIVDGEGGSLMELRSLLVIRHSAATHSKLVVILK